MQMFYSTFLFCPDSASQEVGQHVVRGRRLHLRDEAALAAKLTHKPPVV